MVLWTSRGLRERVLLVYVIMAAACVEQQSVKSESAAPQTPEQQAAALLRAGQFEQAASAMAALGNGIADPAGADYRRRAALLFADLGDTPRALTLLSGDESEAPSTTPRQTLATGIRNILEGSSEKALFTLNSLDAATLEPFEKGLFLRNLGKLQRINHDPAALLNLMNAELFSMPAKRRTELTHLIWENLRVSRDPALADKLDSRNPYIAGWLNLWELTRKDGGDPVALATSLAGWRQQFPAHPANEMLIDEIIEYAEEQSAPIERVALLVPLDGDLARYGKAVRDGFIAMRFASADSRLKIQIYSAADASAPAAYQRAIGDGAQFVVGPLDKPGIEAIAKLPERPIPLLTLNNVAAPPTGEVDGPIPRFTQFGLAPEDEGEDLAIRAWHDGKRRMASIAPNSSLGLRIKSAFEDKWHQLGGTLVNQAIYDNSVSSYKASIRQTFNLAQSEARAARLRRLLSRPLAFEARPRPDLDAILLIADPVSARQIIPQFRYLGVDHLPIYATSMVYSGTVNPTADQDLDSVIFGTLPWLLDVQDQSLRQSLRRYWSEYDITQQSLFAFGVDAYRITKAIGSMTRDARYSIAGATGMLRRDSAGRIKRSLAWAQFRGGAPRLLSNQ